MAEIVTLDCPLFVTVTSRDCVWPTATLPNFTFVGQQLNWFLAWRLVGSSAKRATALIIANLSGRRERACASDWGSRIAPLSLQGRAGKKKIPEVHCRGVHSDNSSTVLKFTATSYADATEMQIAISAHAVQPSLSYLLLMCPVQGSNSDISSRLMFSGNEMEQGMALSHATLLWLGMRRGKLSPDLGRSIAKIQKTDEP